MNWSPSPRPKLEKLKQMCARNRWMYSALWEWFVTSLLKSETENLKNYSNWHREILFSGYSINCDAMCLPECGKIETFPFSAASHSSEAAHYSSEDAHTIYYMNILYIRHRNHIQSTINFSFRCFCNGCTNKGKTTQKLCNSENIVKSRSCSLTWTFA